MQIFFDDLALPRLVRSQLVEMPEMKSQRAGYSSSGTPSNLSVIRSMRGAIGRRVAIGAGSRAELTALLLKLAEMPEGSSDPEVVLARDDARGPDRDPAQPARAHPLSRPDRPALPQPGAPADPDRQGGDVLPDGRLRLDGRSEEGPLQALLHPALPVPDAPLREDRPGLHPPPHPGAGGRRGELLPCPRDRRHRGLERPGADGRDHHASATRRATGTSTAPRRATATTGITIPAAAASS